MVKRALTERFRRSGCLSALSCVALPRCNHYMAALSPPAFGVPTTVLSWARAYFSTPPCRSARAPGDPHSVVCRTSTPLSSCSVAPVIPLSASNPPSSPRPCLSLGGRCRSSRTAEAPHPPSPPHSLAEAYQAAHYGALPARMPEQKLLRPQIHCSVEPPRWSTFRHLQPIQSNPR
jgi:hypothetical protein